MRIARIIPIVGTLIVLAACGEAPRPRVWHDSVPRPTSSATPSSVRRTTPAPATSRWPNARPGERPPLLDPDARRHAAVGALTVGLYLYAALDWANATNNPAGLVPISGSHCLTCRAWIKARRRLRGPHETLIGGRITVRTYALQPNTYDEPGEYALHVTLDQTPIVLRWPSKSRRVDRGVHGFRALVFLAWRHHRWVVVEVFKDGK